MFADLFANTALRAACAAGATLLFVLALIPWLIRLAHRHRFSDRDDKSDSGTLNALHEQKRSTPIVGGIALMSGAVLSSLLFADLALAETWLLIATLVGLAALGFADDWTKTFGASRTRGLSARQKLAGQVLLGLGVGLFLLGRAHWGVGDLSAHTTLSIPFVGASLGIGAVGFALLATFLVTGSSNAVNLTDGLDGLAGGCALVALTVYLFVALVSGGMVAGDVAAASRFDLAFVPGAGEVAVVMGALVGGLTGFLVFNRHPARCFMGDTGSLPLGGVLAVAALLTHQELLLALVGGVFVIEALSVMAQVGSFKLTGKRLLRCAPLHHHFEFKGVSETRIVTGFHTAALLLGLFSLAGLGLGA